VPCIENQEPARGVAGGPLRQRLAALASVAAALWIGGCATRVQPPAAPARPAAPPAPVPVPTAPVPGPAGGAPAPLAPQAPSPAPSPLHSPGPGAPPGTASGAPGSTVNRPPLAGAVPALPTPARVRTWEEYRLQAARRMVAAHPTGSYMGRVPEPLLAIPVLEVELQADGHVRGVRVLRQPGQARDTVQLAIAAVQRAAPFGPVEHLPRPWRFTEAFLFDDARRFKPRSLD